MDLIQSGILKLYPRPTELLVKLCRSDYVLWHQEVRKGRGEGFPSSPDFHHLQSKHMSYDDVSQRFQQLKNWRWPGVSCLTGSLQVIDNRLDKCP